MLPAYPEVFVTGGGLPLAVERMVAVVPAW